VNSSRIKPTFGSGLIAYRGCQSQPAAFQIQPSIDSASMRAKRGGITLAQIRLIAALLLGGGMRRRRPDRRKVFVPSGVVVALWCREP